MRFIAHSHYSGRYEDNAEFIGDFGAACMAFSISNANVSITDAGIVFFLLPKSLNVEEKLNFSAILHGKLKKYETENNLKPKGLSAVMCAETRDLKASELAFFYQGIKEIDSSISTIHCGFRYRNIADNHIIWHMPQHQIVKIMRPEENDLLMPAGGWDAYENSLLKIFADTEAAVKEKIERVVFDERYEAVPLPLPLHPEVRKREASESCGTPWGEDLVPAH